MQPKVSIIVPVYNVEQYLERCIASLRAQTLQELEIILVDDSSTDGSLALCQKAAEEDPRIKVLHKENEGAGMARNAALKVAAGEYIGFVDSDDYVDRKMFQTLYERAETYGSDLVLSGVVFVGGNVFARDGDREEKRYFEEDTHFTGEALAELRMGIIGAMPGDPDDSKYGMSVWKNLFRHQIIKENDLIFQSEREMLSEDALFMVDYIAAIGKATGIPEAFYHYCRNGDSISKSYKKDRFEKSLVFMGEVEKRFEKDLEPRQYHVYQDRFWQAMCRVLCSQELLHAKECGIRFSEVRERLKAICTHPFTLGAMERYPIGTLPLKQRVFAYGVKYRLYFLLKLLVRLRSRG